MGVIAKEQATKEVTDWLDRMDIPSENRELDGVKVATNGLIKAVENGDLIFNEDETVTQKLKSPLGDGATTEIVYDFRYEIGAYNAATKGISLNNEIDWSIARLFLVSKARYPKAVFEKMKRSDFNLASKLTVFF